MIARLRKATTAWTARFRQSETDSTREQSVSGNKNALRGIEGRGETPDIPDFDLLRCIGRGSYGEVWLARNILGTYRAVKIVERKAFRDDEAFEREFSGLQRFEPVSREHDGFVAILHVSRNRLAGFFYYVMELADNDTKRTRIEPDTYVPKTLSNELARCGRLSVRGSVQLGLSLCGALQELHQRGLVHRDVKPSNIIFVKGQAKLADIGLVAQTGERNRLGTEGYIPPEGPGKPQADLYSLGMVLYEASTGIDRLEYPDLPGDVDAMIERETFLKLNAIILKACDNDVRKRYRTASEISDDLTKLGLGISTQRTGRKLRRPIVALSAVVLGALTLALTLYWIRSPRTSSVSEKSIAVLPFENLSPKPEDAYFAEGIQEEILTRLAKISDLRVISRTSTKRYRSKPDNLSEIARQLGVANIVEGSVQKVANQVRVNAQLINAQTDSHLWAESYDRELTNVFGVETEIAKGIAESLQAKLTSHEEQALAAKPTNNPEAYDAYLHGVAFQGRVRTSSNLLLQAIGYFERAVQLDPNFAAAWARLSRTQGYLYFRANTARPDAAKEALEHAQKLQPNSPETLLALGYYQYWVLGDYRHAIATFQLVYRLSPSNGEVAFALSAVNRRDGKWDESLAWAERALGLDPRNGELITMAAWTYEMLRQFPNALKLYDRALDIVTHDPDLMAFEASIYQAQGNLEQAAKYLSDITAETPFDGAFSTKMVQLRLERNHAEAVRLLQARLAQFQFTSEFNKATIQVHLAFAQHLAGDIAAAKAAAGQARNTLELLRKRHPDTYNFAVWLALTYAALGEKDPALREAEHAVMLMQSAKDAVDEPGTEENLALVQAIFGENSRAIATLRRLLQTPFHSPLYGPAPLTPAFLRLDPLWDSLRTDPAFQELCEEKL